MMVQEERFNLALAKQIVYRYSLLPNFRYLLWRGQKTDGYLIFLSKIHLMTRFRSYILLVVSFISFTAKATEKVIVPQPKGENIEITKNPSRVVVFDLGALETYHELGIPVIGMLDNLPGYMSEYQKEHYLKLGHILRPDIEAIKAAQPDLIIINARQVSVQEQLKEIAPVINLNPDFNNYWESFENNVKIIAQIHGKETLAEQKLAGLRAKKSQAQELAAKDDRKVLMVMYAKGNLSGSGKGGRLGFPMDELGVKTLPVFATMEKGSLKMEAGTLRDENNPDVIFFVDRDAATTADAAGSIETIFNDELKQTKAYQNGQVYTLPGDVWYLSGGGLLSVDIQLSGIVKALYK